MTKSKRNEKREANTRDEFSPKTEGEFSKLANKEYTKNVTFKLKLKRPLDLDYANGLLSNFMAEWRSKK